MQVNQRTLITTLTLQENLFVVQWRWVTKVAKLRTLIKTYSLQGKPILRSKMMAQNKVAIVENTHKVPTINKQNFIGIQRRLLTTR